MRLLTAFLLHLCCLSLVAADGPGVVVLGPTAAKADPPPGVPVTVLPGRFVPVTSADGSPCYIAPLPAFKVFTVRPGEPFYGVKYDAPDKAEVDRYTWPDAKGPVYVLLARDVPGVHSIQLVKNGPTETGPVPAGAPIDVKIGQGPIPPPPEPKPPTPDPSPPPSSSPFPLAGFRALIVYETGQLIPQTQHSAIFGKAVADYLESRCALGADGRTKEYRRFDQNQDVSAESPVWRDAMKLPRSSVPWLIVGNGKTGYSGPMPSTVAETMALLRKHGE